MKLHRRRFLQLTAAGIAAPAFSHLALAEDYPARPVRVIAGFGAGGGVDITARLIGQVQAMVEQSGNPEGFDAAHWLGAWLDEPLPALGGLSAIQRLTRPRCHAIRCVASSATRSSK